MRSRSRLLLAAFVALAAMAVAAAALLDLSTADEWASVVGALLSIAALTVAMGRRSVIDRTDPAAAERLARAVHLRWSAELRRHEETGLIPLRWRAITAHHKSETGVGSAALLDFFGSQDAPSLAIAGDPGAGKTTLAIELTLSCLARRGAKSSVPVLFSAAAWRPTAEPLDEFLARVIAEDYALPPAVAGQLVHHGHILPLLDGLDEVLSGPDQSAAVKALRAFHSQIIVIFRGPLARVETPRVTAWRRRFTFVEITAPSTDDFQAYLGGERWARVFTHVRRHPGGELARMMRSSALVLIAKKAFASPESDPDTLLRSVSPLDALLNQAMAPSGQRDRIGLATIATSMTGEDGRISWLRWARHSRGSHLANLLALAGIAVTVGLVTGSVLTNTLVATAIMLGMPALRDRRPLARRIAWTGMTLTSFGVGGIFGALFGISGLLVRTGSFVWDWRIALAALGGTLLGGGERADAQETPSLRADRAVGLLRSAGATTLTAVAMMHAGPAATVVVCSLVFVLTLYGGSAWGRYTVARTNLSRKGLLPWDLDGMLDKALAAGILVRDRNTLAFRHRLLLEHYRSISGMVDGAAQPGGPLQGRILDELVNEVLALPEAVDYIGADVGGTLRGEVRERVRNVIAERRTLLETVEAQLYQRFQSAHRAMIDAVARPLPTRPGRWYLFAALAVSGVALWAAGTLMLSPAALRLAAAGVGGAVLLLLTGARLFRGPQGSLVPAGGGRVALSFVSLTVLAMIVESYLVRSDASRLLAQKMLLPAAIVAALLWVAWSLIKPYDKIWRQVNSHDREQWPSETPELQQRSLAVAQVRTDWLQTLAADHVLPLVEDWLAPHRERLAQTLPRVELARLGRRLTPRQLIVHDGSARLSLLLGEMHSASLGISGPRGAGKSTLLEHFCRPGSPGASPNDCRVLVQAPTKYDRREFLVHLFRTVCEEIGNRADIRMLTPSRGSRMLIKLAQVAGVVIGIALILGTTFWPEINALAIKHRADPRGALIAAGALLSLGCLLWAMSTGGVISPGWRRRRRPPSAAEAMAAEYVALLRYQATESDAAGGKIGGGGAEINRTRTRQRTEYPRTYPELVDGFRKLLRQVSEDRRPYSGKVIIGIDELDKIARAEDVEQFLNDLKAVFGVLGCYFLISVSEDALSAFERRRLGVRTTFDSSFDAIVEIPPLSLRELGALLARRSVHLPEPFTWLCHVLSAGLPRDFLRSVISLVAAAEARSTRDLAPLAEVLIREDLASLLKAQLRLADTFTSAEAPDLIAWLLQAQQTDLTVDGLERLAIAKVFASASHDVERVLSQAQALLYHVATLLRCFVEAPGEGVRWLAGDDDGAAWVETLAHARASLATQPNTSWQLTSRFRERAPGMDPLVR